MTGRLEGKICIITGTGGAIGRALALRFAAEGAKVIGCDVAIAEAQKTCDMVVEAGGEMISVQPCELTSEAECKSLVAHVLATFGRLDIIVNNAGRAYWGWMPELSLDDWQKTINEELNITFLLSKAAWPALSESRGTIVNMASTAGWIGFKALGGVAHSAAKGAIIAMTRHLAMEGRTVGIRANSISPGTIETQATLELMKLPEWASVMTEKIMRGTLGKPEEIAAVALFLASDESSFVNGADIIADGGTTAW